MIAKHDSPRPWEWSEDFPVPLDRADAKARIKVIGTELQDMQQQQHNARGGYVTTEDWDWRRRLGSARTMKLRQLAALQRWLAAAPPDYRSPPDSEERVRAKKRAEDLRLALYLLHRVLDDGVALPKDVDERIRALLAGKSEGESEGNQPAPPEEPALPKVRDIRPMTGGAALIADLTMMIRANERRQVSGCWISNRVLSEFLNQARMMWTAGKSPSSQPV